MNGRAWGTIGLALLAFLLVGCRTAPPAVSVPAGFDLSGDWLLVPDRSDVPPTLLQLRARGGMLHLVVQDFPVIGARRMQIEQDSQSMGLSYDGGTWRDVSWGTRKRGLWEVQSGWQEDRLVILSKAEDADARETFSLDPGGRILTVTVAVRSGGDSLFVTRVFSRS
jgi:hypothetical protein